MLKKWKKISSEDKFKNPWWTYRLDKFELPSGKQGEYHYMHTLDAVYILPVLEDGRVIWVKQYRYLFDRESIEVVAGRVEGDEDLEVAAHRELIEETGFDGDLTKVGSCACEIGLDDSSMHIFVARNLVPSSDKVADETEEFEYVKMLPKEVEAKIASGEIIDGMSIAAWTLAKNSLG